MQTVKSYYRHTRALAAIPAVDALTLARAAFALDRSADAARIAPPAVVSRESLHDGSNPLTLSYGIKVY